MRGVYFGLDEDSGVVDGSSPHARGLRRDDLVVVEEVGIIPACAGFTRQPTPPTGPTGDHPRMRGVYAPYSSGRLAGSGSSPHARGLLG